MHTETHIIRRNSSHTHYHSHYFSANHITKKHKRVAKKEYILEIENPKPL